MAAILFFKMRPKLFTGKTFADQDFPSAILHSEALAPIIREIQGPFSMMTPFKLEAGVIGQIQHMGNIPRP